MNPGCLVGWGWARSLIGAFLLSGFLMPGASWGGLEGDDFSTPSPAMAQAEAHLRLGVDFFLTNELEVAIDEFREAARQQPGYADAYHNLGVALAKTGDLKGAIAAWSQAERLDPQGVGIRYRVPSLVAYNYGVSLLREGRLQPAIKQWEDTIRMQPDFVEAHYALGMAFVAEGNPLPALAHFRHVVDQASEWSLGYEGLGLAHYESHEYDRAREAWLHALELNPSKASIPGNLGMLAVQEGNYQEATEWSRKALERQPDLPSAHFNLGIALYRMGEEMAGLKALQTAWALNPTLTLAPVLIGVVWSHQGQWSKAASIWREALRSLPLGSDPVWLHFNLGVAQLAMGNPWEALSEFRVVVGQRPEWAEGWAQLGQTFLARRQWEQAERSFVRAAELEPRWGHVHYALGKVRLEQGQLEGAKSAFQQAVEAEPSFVEAHYRLGLVWRAQNRPAEAIEPLRRAAEGGFSEAQTLLASMYANGSGIDRNLPLAMVWWFRNSQNSIGGHNPSPGEEQLSRLRRELYAQRLSAKDRQDVLKGFEAIRQELNNPGPSRSWPTSRIYGEPDWPSLQPSDPVLSWVLQKALALDERAQEMLAVWHEHGVPGSSGTRDPRIQDFFLQTGKEGSPHSCRVLEQSLHTGSSDTSSRWESVLRGCKMMSSSRVYSEPTP